VDNRRKILTWHRRYVGYIKQRFIVGPAHIWSQLLTESHGIDRLKPSLMFG
jgi:hypothetical protein